MNKNKTYIKGKYACPLFSLIWFTTILCTVAYIVSKAIDHEFDIILFQFVDIILTINTRQADIIKYRAIFVIDIDILPKIGASKLIRFLISN